jgi:hypothetical protein
MFLSRLCVPATPRLSRQKVCGLFELPTNGNSPGGNSKVTTGRCRSFPQWTGRPTDHRRMQVFACEEQPGSSCVTTTAETNPYHAVTTHRHNLPVELIRRVEIVECD